MSFTRFFFNKECNNIYNLKIRNTELNKIKILLAASSISFMYHAAVVKYFKDKAGNIGW